MDLIKLLTNKSYKTTNGNLLQLAMEGKFNIIVHGCNCFNTMGAGIARAMATTFPQAKAADARTAPGDSSKLGHFTISTAPDIFGRPFIIVNAYTQYNMGNNFDIKALKKVLKELSSIYNNVEIGFPMIGCGIGGGNWSEVEAELKKFSNYRKGINVTVCKL